MSETMARPGSPPPTNGGDRIATINANDDGDSNNNNKLELTDSHIRRIGRFKLRGKTDDLPQDWWFASTAIPLLAATIGPLANVLSIAALVSKWRVRLPNNGQLPEGTDDAGENIPDPTWELVLNSISLVLGFIGNFFLLLNFTRRIRYIVALPATIISWYFATGILTGIIIAVNNYVPPIRPGETYSQGFWYAIIAATLYLIGSMILMINMLGYFLGHYPQHFDLDDDQRTLILQTMMFFFWLAGGAAVFSTVCGFTYANALYFCDVTVLTIGFGDITALNDTGRGLVFPYSVFGIIFLGLMINSIRKFASGMSKDNVIRKHQLNERQRTFGRTVTSEKELRDRLGLPPRKNSDVARAPSLTPTSSKHPVLQKRSSLDQYGHFELRGRSIVFKEQKPKPTPVLHASGRGGAGRAHQLISRDAIMQHRTSTQKSFQRSKRRERLILLKEERDRFNAMRDIQAHTSRFKQYYALSMSVLAFGTLWCVGAAVFMVAEHRLQGLSYFQSLYFCYVSLLTIGYGDFSPRSNAGKPFFVIWSLVAIPTMTILISDMGDTVISAINRGTFTLADWTIMPKAGVWHDFLEKNPRLRDWLARKTKEREEKKRVERGFELQDATDDIEADFRGITRPETAEEEERELTHEDDTADLQTEKSVAEEDEKRLSDHDLARRLALAIRKTANDLKLGKPKKYSYEEWVEFTRLIRFSARKEGEEEGDDVLAWDWIGEDSPMLADVSETEWVLDRLCESLNRYTRKQSCQSKRTAQKHNHEQEDREESCPQTHEQAPQPDEQSQSQFKTSTTTPTVGIPPTNDVSSMERKALAGGLHYPAHPGPRTPGVEVDYHHLHLHDHDHDQEVGRKGKGTREKRGRGGDGNHDISLVLSRGSSGVEIMRLNGGKGKGKEKGKEKEIEKGGEEEDVSAGDGDGGSGSKREGIQEEKDDGEVKE